MDKVDRAGARPAASAEGVRRLALFGALAILLLAVLSAWQLREQVFSQRMQDASRAAQILDEHAAKVIGGHLASLQQIEWIVRDFGLEGATASRLLHDRFQAIRRSHPEVQSIWLFDAAGGVRATSIQHPPPAENFADRDYFQAAFRGDESFVGKVVFGRVTREHIFNLGSRLTDANGRFAGALVVSVYPEYFRHFYASIGPTADAVKLLRADGAVLARHPPPPGDPATARVEPAFMQRLAGPAGTLRAAAAFDDGEYVYAFRRLEGLDLVVVYGISVAHITGEWLQLVLTYALLAAPALLGVCVLGATAYRYAAAADRSREALRALNENLEQRIAERTAELQASEAQMRTLALEVDHRAKNVLATAISIATLTSADTVEAYRAVLLGRLASLGRAQSLLSAGRWSGASLLRIAQEELSAYDDGKGRISLDGPDLRLSPEAAQGLSMLLHELATNAAKCGALSTREGRVALRWTAAADGPLMLRWRESGGPALREPERFGFGMRLIRAVATQQLGGEAAFDWRPEGLSVAISLPAAVLARPGREGERSQAA